MDLKPAQNLSSRWATAGKENDPFLLGSREGFGFCLGALKFPRREVGNNPSAWRPPLAPGRVDASAPGRAHCALFSSPRPVGDGASRFPNTFPPAPGPLRPPGSGCLSVALLASPSASPCGLLSGLADSSCTPAALP